MILIALQSDKEKATIESIRVYAFFCPTLLLYSAMIVLQHDKTETQSRSYLSGFASICSKRNSRLTAISCARAMSVTPFASRMTSSTLMNFGGEA